jgi:hypothetical protein
MFPTAHTTAPYSWRRRDQALETWREAASLVATRWQVYLESDPPTRNWAFAAYLAALDGEQAAATELAWLSTSIAA